ncbi:hypothetical protein [Candidatus Pelagisphaera phototrophica]|uniref:hypothetical protein n=1 Tax=Candidatus Pelagisphaera phototrophica TaxID=2684113 RepID=UPI0019F739A6|nr:hypothetical protein [Candidatus Pelagisphaera phototrophica]QXD33034.1 hypothetical protein GA004_04805 [Candidatus Pelagisphaera phototrophica]
MVSETNIPAIWILVAATVGLIVVLWISLKTRKFISERDRYVLLALRILAIGLIGLIAWNPSIEENYPDRGGFQVALLADLSASMHLPDTKDDVSRVSTVEQMLAADSGESLGDRLTDLYDLVQRGYSDGLIPGRLNTFELKPGVTAIGDSLDELLQNHSAGANRLGGVVLFSDGISLEGQSVFEVAKRYRGAGVPISVVGVGDPSAGKDLKIEFSQSPKEAVFGEPFELQVLVSNEFDFEVENEIVLLDGDEVLDQKPFKIDGGSEKEVGFTVVPNRQGLHLLRVKVNARQAGDLNPNTDVDYAAVTVAEPETMKVLYLSARMSQEYRFLKRVVEEDPGLSFRALIKLGPGKFFQGGFEADEIDSEKPDFPQEMDTLLRYSVLLVDASAFGELKESVSLGLKEFLMRRGGGLVVIGSLDNVPDQLRSILPIREMDTLFSKSRQGLEVQQEPAFQGLAGGVLLSAPSPFLEEQMRVPFASKLSKGARPVLQARASTLPIVAAQAYGAGRVVYMGSDQSWRWKMDSDRGGEQYRLYWQHLLAWLGTGGKPRLEVPLEGSLQDLSEPLNLNIMVRNNEYQLSDSAVVRAVLTGPDGTSTPEQLLMPDSREPGQYRGSVGLSLPGQYRVNYSVEYEGGEQIDRSAFFGGAYIGAENSDLRFRESELKDLARITGGVYYHYTEVDAIEELSLSSSVPMLQRYHYWTRHFLFILLFLGILGYEWFYRRRIGLK